MSTTTRKALGLFLTLTLLMSVSFATEPENIEPEIIELEEDLSIIDPQGRRLADTSSPLRIYPIYTGLSDATEEFTSYLQNDLVPPIIAYFKAALKVKSPNTSGKLSFKSTVTSLCSEDVPSELYSGVEADLAYYFSIKNLADSSTVASSYACFLTLFLREILIAFRKWKCLVYGTSISIFFFLPEKT